MSRRGMDLRGGYWAVGVKWKYAVPLNFVVTVIPEIVSEGLVGLLRELLDVFVDGVPVHRLSLLFQCLFLLLIILHALLVILYRLVSVVNVGVINPPG